MPSSSAGGSEARLRVVDGGQRDAASLVERARGGDLAAWEELYRDQFRPLLRFVAYATGDVAVAEDLVQESFALAFVGLRRFDGRASVRAWLAGITRGVVSNHRRSRVRERRRLELLTQRPDRPEATPDRRLELGRAVASFLDEVDEDQRMAVVLTDIEGLTPAEAAAVLGVSRNTIYSRLRLARAKLRRYLGEVEIGGHRDGE